MPFRRIRSIPKYTKELTERKPSESLRWPEKPGGVGERSASRSQPALVVPVEQQALNAAISVAARSPPLHSPPCAGRRLHRSPGPLAAFLHHAGGVLATPAPTERQLAEPEIRPADVGPVLVTYRWGILHAALVAWPSSGDAARGAGCGRVYFRSGATTPRAAGSAHVTTLPGLGWTVSTRGRAGAYFSLKFRLPLTRVAPDAVRPAPAPFRSRRAKWGRQRPARLGSCRGYCGRPGTKPTAAAPPRFRRGHRPGPVWCRRPAYAQ
jgi:hypothetical protein